MRPAVARISAPALVALGAVVLFGLSGATQIAAASGTHRSARCGTFSAGAKTYGVYIADGKVACSAAEGILKAIAGGHGTKVAKANSASSYVLYRGWLCPYGNMGEQTCEHATHPVSKPSQDIASLSCSFGTGCPKQAVFSNQ